MRHRYAQYGFGGLKDYLYRGSRFRWTGWFSESVLSGSVLDSGLKEFRRRLEANGFTVEALESYAADYDLQWFGPAQGYYHFELVAVTPVDFNREQDARDRVWQIAQQVWPDAINQQFEILSRSHADADQQVYWPAAPTPAPSPSADGNTYSVTDARANNTPTCPDGQHYSRRQKKCVNDCEGFDPLCWFDIDPKTGALSGAAIGVVAVLAAILLLRK
jgi:hypothetical protein